MDLTVLSHQVSFKAHYTFSAGTGACMSILRIRGWQVPLPGNTEEPGKGKIL